MKLDPDVLASVRRMRTCTLCLHLAFSIYCGHFHVTMSDVIHAPCCRCRLNSISSKCKASCRKGRQRDGRSSCDRLTSHQLYGRDWPVSPARLLVGRLEDPGERADLKERGSRIAASGEHACYTPPFETIKDAEIESMWCMFFRLSFKSPAAVG